MVVMAAKMQETECGDGTNFVITLAGELLEQAESLIKMGLHTSYIISGYESALKKAVEFLEKMSIHEIKDVRSLKDVAACLKPTLTSKLLGYSDFFANILADACIKSCPKNTSNFDIEHVRVAKIMGGSVYDSFMLHGLIVTRNAETSINYFSKPKIAVYGQPLDTQASETKGTVLIKNANELLNYTKSEEEHAEKIIKSIADAGVNVIVSGGSISEICLHYIEKYKMMCVRIMSKFELRRLCKCLGAVGIVRMGPPTPEEMGYCDEVVVQEIGSQKITVFKKDTEECKLSTIVLRGSTNNILDDIERALDDGVNTYRMMLKDGHFVAGAGATEIVLFFFFYFYNLQRIWQSNWNMKPA
jgi:T-complex protein 1 subunit theta